MRIMKLRSFFSTHDRLEPIFCCADCKVFAMEDVNIGGDDDGIRGIIRVERRVERRRDTVLV